MSCGFTLEHYRELLHAARAGGYRFTHFDEPPRRGQHAVDQDLRALLAPFEQLGGDADPHLLTSERAGGGGRGGGDGRGDVGAGPDPGCAGAATRAWPAGRSR